MGKPKNKTKGKEIEDSDSDIDVVQESEEKSKPAGKVSKKDKRKKKKDDDWEDDIANELATLSMEANKGREEEVDQNGVDEPIIPKKEKKKKKKGRQEESDEEEDQMEDTSEQKPAKGGKKKPAASFQMLMMEDDDDMVDKSQSEGEKSEEETVQKIEPTKQQKKKEKKKKGKEKTAEEEDVDALLAEIEKPKEKTSKKSKKERKKEAEAEEEEENQMETEVTEVAKVEPKVVTMEDLEDEDDDRKKRKKKKGKKEETEEKEEGKEEDGEEEGSTMKTAAQKKKEKKEREKQKKMADKKKQLQKKDGKSEEGTDKQPDTADDKSSEATGTTAGAEEHGEEKGSGDEGEEEGGKKKKKKKKGEKEEPKKKTKKAPVAAIKELLKKQKEEEERLQREEDERIRKEEEAIKLREEQKRLEEEKRQKKKEKEKARKERLKQEGKLLTEKQKQDKRRAMQLLEKMKEQGLELPQKEEGEEKKPRRPVYDKKRRRPQQKTDDSQESKQETPSPDETPTSTPLTEEAPVVEVEVKDGEGVAEEEAKDTWEEEEEEDTKDAWDASSDEEAEEESVPVKEEAKTEAVMKEKKEVKEESEEEEESDDEEESEEEDDESEEETESSEDDEDLTAYERAEIKIRKRQELAEKKKTTDVLRAPVVCVLGHVDTGKTKILDKLRRTNVQDGEAGGITQQIGATNVPEQALRDKTTMCKEFQKKELKLPGLLIIDTPGHESFSNLRSRGSSLCDIAILVIDIMHGLEPQTIESINLLKDRKTPFIVALNKIDRLYQWKSNPNSDVMNTIKRQTPMCKQEFDERSRDAIVQLAEQGLNAALFYENKNQKEYVSLVPTSAHSGDGMGNLVALIVELCQTLLAKKLAFSEELQSTVMEVKALPGLGTTVDVILVNGTLHEGDHIVIAGTEGPICTQIRGLLMPQPMRELRVKSQYEHHKEVLAAQGVKIIGKDLEKALAGLPLYVAHDDDEVEYYKEEISKALKDVLNSIKLTERGVFVQASTLGSLEALLEFLRTEKIPYAGINIGPVHRKDIMKASIMLEHDSQYAVILAFDVKVERDAQEMAESLGVTIFTADIIYHLQDKFTKFREDLKRRKQEEFKHIAVFPCKLRVLPNCIFNSRDPIVIGVSVEAGFVKHGTPICVPSKEFVELGRITSIEVNHKTVDIARKGQEVCIKIENIPGETPKLYGRHFDHTDMLMSKVCRASIDAVKDYFRDDMTKPDWALMVELKKLFQVL